jgi:tetratricopeptide (TPR) repeat protein
LYAQIPPDDRERGDATFRLGYLRLLRGDYAASAADFETCLRKRPQWPEACLNAGIAYARSGRPVEARRCFQQALAQQRDSTDALRGLTALALEQQDYNEAFELHQRLIKMGEHSAELYYNAAVTCQQRGQIEDAVQFYKQALSEEPQFAEALLNLGHALMAMGQEDEARSCWRRAILEKPALAERYFDSPSA